MGGKWAVLMVVGRVDSSADLMVGRMVEWRVYELGVTWVDLLGSSVVRMAVRLVCVWVVCLAVTRASRRGGQWACSSGVSLVWGSEWVLTWAAVTDDQSVDSLAVMMVPRYATSWACWSAVTVVVLTECLLAG